ncbi:hypothetical protein ALON55S_03910 [Alishewanella longhuensis]
MYSSDLGGAISISFVSTISNLLNMLQLYSHLFSSNHPQQPLD